MEGQRKLKNAQVLLVGTGGLGSPIALYLSAAGIGHIGIVDDDQIELSNLNRQIIHGSQSLGQKKVESARKRMLAINPNIQVDIYPEYYSVNNALRIAKDFDFLLDGTDNFASRYLMNDVCVLTQKTYVFGSVYQFEGQASVFNSQQGPCYRCVFPEIKKKPQSPPTASPGVVSSIPGTIGSIQATETIKLILNIGSSLIGKLLVYDGWNCSFQSIRIKKRTDCPICGEKPHYLDLSHHQTPK